MPVETRTRLEPEPCYLAKPVYGERRLILDPTYIPIAELPAKPTDHVPGSVEKIEALCQRVDAGEPLWHPGDATYEGCDAAVTRVKGRRKGSVHTVRYPTVLPYPVASEGLAE